MVLCVTVHVCNHKFSLLFCLFFCFIYKDKYGLDCVWMYTNNNCAYCPMFKDFMFVYSKRTQ